MIAVGPLAIHAGCVILVALDLTARALRIRILLRGLGHKITLRQAFVVNGFGDAACALTPYRFGGEPARLAGMLRTKAPALAAVIAVGYEVVVVWPTVGAVALLLTWFYAGEWGRLAVPRLVSFGRTYWQLVLLAALASVAAGWLGARGLRAMSVVGQTARQARHYLSRMPWWAIAACLPLTLVSLGARIGLLPTLALGLPSPPSFGTTAFGSFAMLYSQLVLPTPAGAGVVELGFLGGAAGELGERKASLLVAWRFYSSGVAVIFGIVLALRTYGVSGLRHVLTIAVRRMRSGRREKIADDTSSA